MTRTLHIFNGGSDADMWRSGDDYVYEYCTLRTKEHFVLAGRNPNTGGKKVYEKQYYTRIRRLRQ